jgi:hypothetical protein
MNSSLYDALLIRNHEKVYIQNKIFFDLARNTLFSTKNIVFIYAYYCLICYLFRYCKYGQGRFLTNEDIKEILGYQRKYAGVDYLIKRGGVLDHIGYTECIRDFPLQYKLESQYVEFKMYSELEQETKKVLDMPRNFYIKKPIMAFYKDESSSQNKIYDGTFYEIENTHLFDISILVEMMVSGLSLNEFYIYQFFRHKTDLFKSGYSASYERIEKEVRIPVRSLKRIILKLEEFDYLNIIRDIPKGKETRPNIYEINR